MKLYKVEEYRGSDVELSMFFSNILKNIRENKEDYKKNTHSRVQTLVKFFFSKEGISVNFVKLPPENGIGNNWSASIVGRLSDNPFSKIELGVLRITNDMFGKEIVSFITPDENKIGPVEISVR